MSRRYMKLKEVMPLYSGEGSGRNFLRRYRKLEEDMPLYSGEDRGRYFLSRCSASRQMSFISFCLQSDREEHSDSVCIKTNVFYLLLSSSTSFYLLLSKRQSELAKVELNLITINALWRKTITFLQLVSQTGCKALQAM